MNLKSLNLNDTQVHGVLLNAMYCAAREYERLAEIDAVEGMTGSTVKAIAKQFKEQAQAVRALAEQIECARAVNLILD